MYHRNIPNQLSHDDTLKFYKAYQKLSQQIQDPDNEYWYRLQKGELAIINNFRILHGRSKFNGKRVLFTAYTAHDDWISKAKTLNVF